jgi:hypothetical protein
VLVEVTGAGGGVEAGSGEAVSGGGVEGGAGRGGRRGMFGEAASAEDR